MEIRVAKKSDNLNQVAQLIYETDNYIYPAMSENKEQTIKILIEMIKSNTIYNYNNCIIAIQDSQIVGLIVVLKPANSTSNYDKWLNSNKMCKHVIENYILKCEENLQHNQISIICVCVKTEYRRQKIATQMLYYLFNMFPNQHFQLDTLKTNLAAINLYKSVGFQIEEEHKGYNRFYQRKPICYNMKKF